MTASPLRFLAEQGPSLAALGRVVAASLRPLPRRAPLPLTPGPWVTATLPPRSPALVAAYLRHVGADPAAYRHTLPPHLFPQWSFPLLARVLAPLPYRMVSVLNAGCGYTVHAPLPAHEPLLVRARLRAVDADERRVLLHQQIVTGTASAPSALACEVTAWVRRAGPGRRADDASDAPAAEPRPELGVVELEADAGLTFAALTGDLNPIHWSGPWARRAGLGGPIAHGFSTFARAVEVVHRVALGGDVERLRQVSARFVRPVRLPAVVSVRSDGRALEAWSGGRLVLAGEVGVGAARGGPPSPPRCGGTESNGTGT